MKKGLFLSWIAVALLLGTQSLEAKESKQSLMQKAAKVHQDDLKKTPKEIGEGLQLTMQAVQKIAKHQEKEAQKLLEKASSNFEKALKANPDLELIPVEENVEAFEFDADSKVIEKILNDVRKLLKEHDTQEAIALVSPLKDELDIAIVSIPMKLYPASTKKALELLKKGDAKGALVTLEEGFGTIVTTISVIPTPLLSAQSLVIAASELDKSKREEAKKLLEAAKEELRRGELLGYTHQHTPEYQALTQDINEIEKEIKGKNAVEKLYDKLKKSFGDLIGKLHHEKHQVHNQAEQKVKAYEKSETIKAKDEMKIFKQEADSDVKKTVK